MADIALSAGSPTTPDYDAWPVTHLIISAKTDGAVLSMVWDDGLESRFHAFWLRENEPSSLTHNPETRELRLTPLQLPETPTVANAAIDADGFLSLDFPDEGLSARYHPGWLRQHDYSNGGHPDDAVEIRTLWSAGDMDEPPTFDGADFVDNPNTQEQFLRAAATYGFARLRNTPVDPMYVDSFAAVVGPVRDNNFGRLWDVRVEPDPQSNAYSSLELVPHSDLCTREYQPGLQILHCIWNSTSGGAATMVDAFKVARDLELEEPEIYRNLTTVNRIFTNRSRYTDYRWESPPIVLHPDGALKEVRIGAFLRGPTNQPFAMMEEIWRADRELYRRVSDPKYMISYRYEPGDLVMFDNRRLLHGRQAFDEASGKRWLRGCYIEREELQSAVRMAARRKRQKEVAFQN
jgi:gamma-butyrobetaine dioxygenase